MFKKTSKLPIHWSKIEASAPGKFVLIGDYGDLYDRSVIAVAIDRRLRVTIRSSGDEWVRLNLKNFNETWAWPTRLPIFSMTRMIARFAETLAYNETMLQKLKPLLNEKYLTKLDSDQQHSTTSGRVNASETNQMHTSESYSQSQQQQSQPLQPPHDRRQAHEVDKNQADSSKICDLNPIDRQSSEREQADMAVFAFLLLYISLSDSYALSIRPSIDVEVESDIPIGRGLGSSSAYTVALCGGLMKVFRVSAEPNVVIEWTQALDKIFHGGKSSLHSSVAVHGGYIHFEHGKMRSQGVQHQTPLKLMLIDTGVRRDPKLVINALGEKLSQKLDTINTVMESLNELISGTWRRMSDQDFMPCTIDDSLVAGQKSLDLIGMGHQNSSKIFQLARQSHLTVKQSQAGETVFLLYDGFEDYENVMAFRETLKLSGFRWLNQRISFEGFKVLTTDLENVEPFPKLQ